MENTEIIMNEEVMDEVMELVPEKSGVNFGKIGFGVLAAGAVVALGYKCFKIIKEKKAQKAAEAEITAAIEENDFESEDESEE